MRHHQNQYHRHVDNPVKSKPYERITEYFVWLQVCEPQQAEKVAKIASFTAGALSMLIITTIVHFIL